jgi:hypothetical protein
MAPSDSMPSARDRKPTPAWGGKEHHSWSESIPVGCCGKPDGDLVSPWMDWVESGVEFFGCEGGGEGAKSVIGRALMLQHNTERVEKEERDFAKMHEEFFDSLLKEQVTLKSPPNSIPGLTVADSLDESTNSGVSSASSVTFDTESASSIKTQKRRRPLKFQRLSPRGKHHARVAPIDAYNQRFNPDLQRDQTDQLSIDKIVDKEIPTPSHHIHPDCVLQKDKGKGDALGASIRAEGKFACLEKLREKMAIVVHVSGDEGQAATGLKRRAAKVSEHSPAYIETRSIIELRLGFLSMQYGLLLQWDYHRTGKIVFMVLRKMCHDSFYTKIPDLIHQETKTTTITRKQLEAPPLVVRNKIGNHAIYQRINGTEVVLVDPPYRVAQPEVFAPSVLTADIQNVAGLSKRSRWTISITFDGHTETAHLHYNPDKHHFEVRHAPMTWEMTPVTSFDLAGLEIRLFEQQKRKHSKSRLAATMTMPLGGLVAQPSTSETTSWQLTMPFTHDPKASLTLSLVHQSDYAHWLYKELDARRTEEVTDFVWKAPFRKLKCSAEEDPSDDLFDWLCGVCFKEYYLPV